MGITRPSVRRIWHALRTPWAAMGFLAFLAADGYWQVRQNYLSGDTLLERGTIACGLREPGLMGYSCRPFSERIHVEMLPNRVVRYDKAREQPHFDRTLEAYAARFERRHGLWSQWIDVHRYRTSFHGPITEDEQEVIVQDWWRHSEFRAKSNHVLVGSVSNDGFKTYDVYPAGLVHELAALMSIALLARATWYTAFHWRSDRRRARGGCPSCGYSREGLEPGTPCPECGTCPP